MTETSKLSLCRGGNIFWARRGARKAKSAEVSVNSTDFTWWPCIVFLSWADAANSGFMNGRDNKPKTSVSIHGCFSKVTVENLKKNLVPMRVVLSSKQIINKDKKVVVHFLGRSSRRLSSWATVAISGLRLYRKNAIEMMSLYKEKINRFDWQDLLDAVEEASILIEDPSFGPTNLVKKLTSTENENSSQRPQNFDDWKSGTESQTQSQHAANFSQAVKFIANLELSKTEKLVRSEKLNIPSKTAVRTAEGSPSRISPERSTLDSSLAEKSGIASKSLCGNVEDNMEDNVEQRESSIAQTVAPTAEGSPSQISPERSTLDSALAKKSGIAAKSLCVNVESNAKENLLQCGSIIITQP